MKTPVQPCPAGRVRAATRLVDSRESTGVQRAGLGGWPPTRAGVVSRPATLATRNSVPRPAGYAVLFRPMAGSVIHSKTRAEMHLAPLMAVAMLAVGAAGLASHFLAEGVDSARTGWVRDEKVFTTGNVSGS